MAIEAKQTSTPAKHMVGRRVRAVVATVALAASTAFFSGSTLGQTSSRAVPAAEWNRIVAAAHKEGKVTLYGTMAIPIHERISAEWARAYPGIKLDFIRIVGAAMTTKFDQERAIPGFDGGDAMITADVRWALDLQRQGLLKTPLGPGAAAYPDTYMVKGQIAMLGISPWVIAYNTNLVSTPINSYEDLLRPDLAGKVGSVSLIAEVVTAWYLWLDQAYPGFIEKFAATKPRMYPAGTGASAAVASGEILVNAFSLNAIDNALRNQKAPLRTVLPNPVQAFSYGGAVVSWAKNPNAALVVMDFLMSTRGQTAIVGNQDAASPLPNLPGSIDISKSKVQMLDWEKTTPEMLKAYEAKWQKLFQVR